jgi:hypothetical protein
VNIAYCFASPKGDILIDEAVLDRLFAIGPAEFHEFLTLRDFFDSVKHSLMDGDGSSMTTILSAILGRSVKTDEVEEVVIRYEKYGTLYQICSVHAAVGGSLVRMCATVALTEQTIQTLEQESGLLVELENEKNLGFLPKVYKKDWVEAGKGERKEKFLIVFLEWFEGYDEWHFQRHEGVTKAFVWDMREGYRYLSEAQTVDLISQASRILTLYYDVETGRRIIPWHHGAGDFVVGTSDAGVGVKLITARAYEPIMNNTDEGNDPLKALCAFSMEIVTRMRLDKWEGMGDSTWADGFVAEAALKGFVEGLKAKEAQQKMGGLSVKEVLQTLRSLEPEELKSLIKEGFADFEGFKSEDYTVVAWNLEKHAAEIKDALWKLTA